MAAPVANAPRVRVAAVATLDGKLLTVRHRKGADRYHLLPGGGLRWGETLEDALRREVLEETGLIVDVGRPLLISDTIDPSGTRHLVNIVFQTEVSGGSVTDLPGDDRVEAVDLVDIEDLESLDLRPPVADALMEYLRAPERFPTRYLGPLFRPEV